MGEIEFENWTIAQIKQWLTGQNYEIPLLKLTKKDLVKIAREFEEEQIKGKKSSAATTTRKNKPVITLQEKIIISPPPVVTAQNLFQGAAKKRLSMSPNNSKYEVREPVDLGELQEMMDLEEEEVPEKQEPPPVVRRRSVSKRISADEDILKTPLVAKSSLSTSTAKKRTGRSKTPARVADNSISDPANELSSLLESPKLSGLSTGKIVSNHSTINSSPLNLPDLTSRKYLSSVILKVVIVFSALLLGVLLFVSPPKNFCNPGQELVSCITCPLNSLHVNTCENGNLICRDFYKPTTGWRFKIPFSIPKMYCELQNDEGMAQYLADSVVAWFAYQKGLEECGLPFEKVSARSIFDTVEKIGEEKLKIKPQVIVVERASELLQHSSSELNFQSNHVEANFATYNFSCYIWIKARSYWMYIVLFVLALLLYTYFRINRYFAELKTNSAVLADEARCLISNHGRSGRSLYSIRDHLKLERPELEYYVNKNSWIKLVEEDPRIKLEINSSNKEDNFLWWRSDKPHSRQYYKV